MNIYVSFTTRGDILSGPFAFEDLIEEDILIISQTDVGLTNNYSKFENKNKQHLSNNSLISQTNMEKENQL